jgi:alkylation response protein AidB-like acyl-CoA dehydrogenase
METQLTAISLVETAKSFADAEVRPLAGIFDQGTGVSREMINRMGELGLLGAGLPAEYGGGSCDALQTGLIALEVGKACCSVRSVLTVHSSLVGESISRLGSLEQKRKWLPAICSGTAIGAFALSEPATGSDAAAVQANYTMKDGCYVINGMKKWITLGALADFFIVIARCDNQVSAFIVDSDQQGISIQPIKGMIGNRGSHVAQIQLDNVTVGPERLLCSEGLGFSHVVNIAMDCGRHSIAWAGQAITEEALTCMVTYARTRKQFGQPLGRISAIRAMIADATVAVHAGRQLCTNAALLRNQRHENSIHETIIAKVFTSRNAVKTANDAVQLLGANGCCSDYPAERLLRESKILEVIEGTTQILQEVIADFSLKQNFKKT